VAAHKKIKNELTSRGLYELYRNEDFCSKRIIAEIWGAKPCPVP